MLTFAKYKQLETEGVFFDERIQYLLSALCQLSLLNLSTKGGDIEELMLFFGEPDAVRMRKPTAEDKAKSKKKKIEQGKNFGRGLLALGQGQGIKVKTVSKQQFFKELDEDVL